MKNIKSELTYRVVMNELRRHIESEMLTPGDRLPTEQSLAETLGVSRGTVREALKALEILGILETRRGAGMFVKAFSLGAVLSNVPFRVLYNRKELLEFLEVRKVLECEFVQITASQRDDHKIKVLESLFDQMATATEDGDAELHAETDYAFHKELYRDLDNGLVIQLIDSFSRFLNEADDRAVSRTDDMRTNLLFHRQLLESILDRDPDAARDNMAKHFEGVEQRLQLR